VVTQRVSWGREVPGAKGLERPRKRQTSATTASPGERPVALCLRWLDAVVEGTSVARERTHLESVSL
jgi:hypothetical protein